MLLLTAALLCLHSPAETTAAEPKRDAMTSQGFLRLADDAFFAPISDLRPAMKQLMFSDFEGLALDAPRAVDIDLRATLPVAALAVRRTAAAFDWIFGEHTILVASDVDRFRCLADVVAPPTRQILPPPPRPPPPGSQSKVGDKATIDARARLHLPWEPSTWQLVLLTRDVRSDTARVTLRKGAGPVDPAPSPLPGARLTVTASGKGLDTALDVKLDVRASRANLPPLPGGSDRVAVPVTFLVTGHDRPAPYLGQRSASGHFGPPGQPEHVAATLHTTLREIAPALPGGDLYYLWIFAGDQVAEPVRIDARLP